VHDVRASVRISSRNQRPRARQHPLAQKASELTRATDSHIYKKIHFLPLEKWDFTRHDFQALSYKQLTALPGRHAQGMTRMFRFPEVRGQVAEYLLCVLFHFLLPLLPLLIEAAMEGAINHKTLILFLSVYPLSLGISSRSKFVFGLGVVTGLTYAIFFGIASALLTAPNWVKTLGYLCASLVALLHLFERYNRHIAEDRPFLEFS
jgi:hypothetical protein